MVDKDYSLDALNRFLDYASSKGLLKRNTAKSRKLAANKILGVVDQEEQTDLRRLDMDLAFDRFQNLQGTDYSPESLQVYKSRLRSALSDFVSYVDNPSGFKPTGAQRSSSGGGTSPAKATKTKNETRHIEGHHGDGDSHKADSHQIVVPVPLREGLTVKISNLPSDLTDAEAARLAAIIKAYAVIEAPKN